MFCFSIFMRSLLDVRDEFKHRTHIELILFDPPPHPPRLPVNLLSRQLKGADRDLCAYNKLNKYL